MLAPKRLVLRLAFGFFLGAVLALSNSPPSAFAEEAETCLCEENGLGSFKCDEVIDTLKCVAGSKTCELQCK